MTKSFVQCVPYFLNFSSSFFIPGSHVLSSPKVPSDELEKLMSSNAVESSVLSLEKTEMQSVSVSEFMVCSSSSKLSLSQE